MVLMHPCRSLEVHQTPKSHKSIDLCIQIHQICVNKHDYDIHIKFEVSLHFWPIWPTVRRRYATAFDNERSTWMEVCSSRHHHTHNNRSCNLLSKKHNLGNQIINQHKNEGFLILGFACSDPRNYFVATFFLLFAQIFRVLCHVLISCLDMFKNHINSYLIDSEQV